MNLLERLDERLSGALLTVATSIRSCVNFNPGWTSSACPSSEQRKGADFGHLARRAAGKCCAHFVR